MIISKLIITHLLSFIILFQLIAKFVLLKKGISHTFDMEKLLKSSFKANDLVLFNEIDSAIPILNE